MTPVAHRLEIFPSHLKTGDMQFKSQ